MQNKKATNEIGIIIKQLDKLEHKHINIKYSLLEIGTKIIELSNKY